MDTLVLGEGYNSIYIELGVLSKIENKLSEVKNYVGTGNSCFLCLLLALDFSVNEIIEKCVTNNLIKNIYSIPNNFASIFEDDSILEFTENLLISKLGFSPTMKQFFNSTGKKLFFSIPNVTKKKVDFISHKSNMTVMDGLGLVIIRSIVPRQVTYTGTKYINGLLGGNMYPMNLYKSKFGSDSCFGIKIETSFEESSESLFNQLLSIIVFSLEVKSFDEPDGDITLTIKSKVSNNLKSIDIKEIAESLLLGYDSING